MHYILNPVSTPAIERMTSHDITTPCAPSQNQVHMGQINCTRPAGFGNWSPGVWFKILVPRATRSTVIDAPPMVSSINLHLCNTKLTSYIGTLPILQQGNDCGNEYVRLSVVINFCTQMFHRWTLNFETDCIIYNICHTLGASTTG